MPRRLPLAQVSRLVGLATDALKSVEPRSEQRKVVDAYLHAIKRATDLAGKSKMNRRRGWGNIADRQKTRSEAFSDQAAALLPLVDAIVSPPSECPAEPKTITMGDENPAGALSRVAKIFSEDGDED